MINKIEEIVLEINRLKAGTEVLEPLGVEIQGNKEDYRFKKDGVEAMFSVEEREGLIIGRISLTLENLPFRENDNLGLEHPVKIGLKLAKQPQRMTAMYLHRDWWTRPAFINDFSEMPERTQSLYMDYGSSTGYLLPMSGEKYKTVSSAGNEKILTLEMTAYLGGMNKVEEIVFIYAEGKEIYDAVQIGMGAAAEERGIPLKEKRYYPDMFEYLGWCSWDAFYTDISEEKVRAKAEELIEKQVPVRWFLMDDGWLSVREQRLYDLLPEKEKFPDGFKQMIRDVKGKSNIEWFGVWHAFGGYWGGLEPDSDAARAEASYLYETSNGKLLPHPTAEKGYGFFKDWYELLRTEGIDFVKVDGQSAIKNYYENNMPVCLAAKGTHEALEGAAAAYMGGRLINCMGMAMENILGRPGSGLSRNSDDFVPDNETGFAEHLLQNSYNAIYHDELYYCDWDMFWTFHPDSVKHGILRGISGGPVYISDQIGDTKKDAILPLAFEDGKILRMDRTAKPSSDCIFTDPQKTGWMKLTNIANCGGNKKGGAIAVYNIGSEEAKTTIEVGDIYDLQGEEFYLYDYRNGNGQIIRRTSQQKVNLAQGGCGLYLFVPSVKDCAVVGLLDKYISFLGIEEIFYTPQGMTVLLYQAGTFGFYSENLVNSILVNGEDCTGRLEVKDNFYRIELSGNGKILVTVS